MAKHNGGLRLQGGSGSSASADVLNSQTACDLGYDWKNGRVHASTTGSQYGIYDMSGGALEYVMGVQKDSNGNVQVGSSGFSTSNLPDSKYYDLYDYQNESVVNYFRYYLGDATKEVLKDTNCAWWLDYARTIYTLQPWVYRGGGSGGGYSNNGIFRFDRESGINDPYATFRTIITAS